MHHTHKARKKVKKAHNKTPTKRRSHRGGDAPYNSKNATYASFTVARYFKNLDLPESVQTDLMNRLHLNLQELSTKARAIFGITSQPCPESAEWKKCSGECETLFMNAMKQEAGSTAFVLKVLADSVIRPDGLPHRLKFSLDPLFFKEPIEKQIKKTRSECRLLTGRWADDAPFLHLELPKNKKSNAGEQNVSPGRLIIGFGPSSSGKTYWAKTILKLLKGADPTFPELFFADDGGLIRESSATYQFAKEMAHYACFAGFSNLHDMFNSGAVKKTMEAYWLQESQRIPIHLYVPETLGGCDFMIPKIGVTIPVIRPCPTFLKKFFEITRDPDWIGLLIWQHKTAADHTTVKDNTSFFQGPEYKCAGCTESGLAREKTEGKKYSNSVYEQSMKNGRKYMMEAPGGRYEIHNAGRRGGTSILFDTSPLTPVTNALSKMMMDDMTGPKKYGVKYVDQRKSSKLIKNGLAPFENTVLQTPYEPTGAETKAPATPWFKKMYKKMFKTTSDESSSMNAAGLMGYFTSANNKINMSSLTVNPLFQPSQPPVNITRKNVKSNAKAKAAAIMLLAEKQAALGQPQETMGVLGTQKNPSYFGKNIINASSQYSKTNNTWFREEPAALTSLNGHASHMNSF